jgi:hypothetical protein
MARFHIRRNHPHTGVLALCKIPGGGFAAKETIVTEAEFIKEVTRYLKELSPAEKNRLRRAAALLPLTPAPPPGNGEIKPVSLHKAVATG